MTVTHPTSVESLPDDSQPGAGEPRWRRVMGATGRALVGAGVILVLFAGFQVWGTGIHEARAQSALRDEFESRLARAQDRIVDLLPAPDLDETVEGPTPFESTTEGAVPPADTSEPSVEAARGQTPPDPELLGLLFPENGDAVARIEIPALEVNKVVVRGVHVADLRKGPGLYPSTVLPGNFGNAAIAGHRTTYGAPFNQIDQLTPGDEIVLTTIQGRFTYRVAEPETAFANRSDDVAEFGAGHVVVKPNDTWVLDDFGDNRLTLTACHPKYSARERIIVAAELVSEPVGLPEPIADIVEAIEQGDLPGEEPGSDPVAHDPEADGEARATFTGLPPTFDVSDITGRADLDQGLSGDRGAIPVAIFWLALAIGLWLLGVRFARGQVGWKRRLLPYATVLVPVAVTLWLSFEAADRALPAY